MPLRGCNTALQYGMPLAYRLLVLLMVLVGVGGYAYWAVNGGLVREGNWIGVDFHVYYQAGLALSRGEDIYGGAISPPYVYPPLLALLVVPLTFLPVTTATIIWKVLQHVCLVTVGGLLVSMLPAGRRALTVGVLCLGLLTVAVQEEIQVGESNSLVLLLVVGAIWLVARGGNYKLRITNYELGAGLLLGLAVSIKVLPVLVVAFFLWRGPRRVGVVAVASFVALQLVTLAVTPATLNYWLVEFPGLFGQAFPFPDNQSINAFISRAVLPDDPNLPAMRIVKAEGARPILTWGLNLLVMAGATFVLWRSRNVHEGKVVLFLQVGLVMLTTFLVSGSTWLHHLVGLAVPVVGLIGASESGYRPAAGRVLVGIGAAIGFGLLLRRPYDWLFSASEIAPGNEGLALVASTTALWVVVGLWLAVAWKLVRLRDVAGREDFLDAAS